MERIQEEIEHAYCLLRGREKQGGEEHPAPQLLYWSSLQVG